MKSIFKNWSKGSVLLTDVGWGDSGKGKCVSYLQADIGAKIIGGNNAGHTIVTDKGKFSLGYIPSTITNPQTMNLIGPEVVINLTFLKNEIETLNDQGFKISPATFILDPNSHLIMPWHKIRDALSEEAKDHLAIGSLHLGVGWTYSDRVNRCGLRLLDLYDRQWQEKLLDELANQEVLIKQMAQEVKRKTGHASQVDQQLDSKQIIKDYRDYGQFFKPYLQDTIAYIWKAINSDKKIVFEDSHGAMLDISHGSWPYTTGVNVALGAIYRSFGGKTVRSLKRILVATKAYQTRVGGGPMPTEDSEIFGNLLRQKGSEMGARSGRPRRCGPIDLPLIRYGLNVAGVDPSDEIALTKLDVLSGFNTIPLCVAYQFQGKKYSAIPHPDAQTLFQVKAIYHHLPGWKEDISSIRNFKDLPVNAQKYVLFIEKQLRRNITFIGVGQHQNAVILR
ncbi:hypothetical protein COY20_00055 [Candidatus Shapirobacteria bacterium CG_4_10_14_0_2_um_filter_40_12]|uniref:Adenylosuccinate synthetase n=1 Tax=Candidatus Shapirobacteria bacterium CG_4_10_14_0_2_um_filter_40_12 TaxID=1974871 RepID=A0A2M7TUL2_9BACT|nr:MAG: hypothetical protein COY20_00055 [Candidatus Shapirobacteria bacterium CG_4_10_14_0_2_um_filter_40_12]